MKPTNDERILPMARQSSTHSATIEHPFSTEGTRYISIVQRPEAQTEDTLAVQPNTCNQTFQIYVAKTLFSQALVFIYKVQNSFVTRTGSQTASIRKHRRVRAKPGTVKRLVSSPGKHGTSTQMTIHRENHHRRANGHTSFAHSLLLPLGRTGGTSGCYHFPLELRFVRADELVDLLPVLEEEECRGCTDVPGRAEFLDMNN